MKFEQALKLLREGKKIKIKDWETPDYITNKAQIIMVSDIMTGDWEEYVEDDD